jgi:hypothetical protein
MQLGICSFALHRSFAAGTCDLDGFAALSRATGCTALDPWNAHLTDPADAADTLHAGRNPDAARLEVPGPNRIAWL